MDANWHPDPTGRFGQRFFDGRAWTDHVIGANGQTLADPLTQELPPPPPGSAVTSAAGAAAGAGATTSAGPRTTSWYGMAVAGVGAILTLLSLYALDWADSLSANDLRDGIPSSLPDGLDVEDVIAFRYVQWGGLVLLLACLVGLAAVAVGIRGRDADGTRVLAAVAGALGALVHTFTVVRLFAGDGPDPALGAWLGTLGFLAVIVGCAIATPTTRRAAA
jgi:hypothetical protein